MEWVIFFTILGLTIIAFPAVLRFSKSSAIKGTAGSMVMALGMAFSGLLDPAKRESVENLEKEKDIGNANEDAAGDPEC
jgi:hypothetical protein